MKLFAKDNFFKRIYRTKTWIIIFGIIIFYLSFNIKAEIIAPLLILFVILSSTNLSFPGAIVAVIFSLIILGIRDLYIYQVSTINFLADILVILISGFFIITREVLLRKNNSLLAERIKELNCLYKISEILEKTNVEVDKIMEKILELIPPAFQYPEDIYVRIIYDEYEYRTENYRKSPWKLSSKINVNNINKGRLDIGYVHEHPRAEKGPFLKEETNLTAVLAERIGNIIYAREKEIELIENNNFLAITLNSIGDAVIVTDNKGIIVQMNPIAEELTGWTSDEAKGKKLSRVFKIINSITGEPVIDPAKRVLNEGKILGLANHTKLISRNGKEYHIADSASPIKDAKNNIYGVIIVFRNYSEKYRMREEIKRREKLFSTAINRAPFPIMIHAEDGEVVQINKIWTELTGYSPEEIPTITDWTLKAFGSKQKIIKNYIENLYHTEDIYNNGEYEITTKNGDKRIWDFNSALLGSDEEGRKLIISIAKDMTNYKFMQARINKLNRMFMLLSDINQSIVRTRSQENLFRKICKIIDRNSDYKSVWFGKISDLSDEIIILASGGIKTDYLEKINNLYQEKGEKCPINRAVNTGKNIISNKLDDDERIIPCIKHIKENDFQSIAVFPLKVFNKIWGVFVLFSDKEDHFDADEIRILEELSDDIAFAVESIENEKLRKEFAERLRKSEKKYRSLITNAPVGVFKTSSKGKTLLANPEMAKILNCLTPEEAIHYYNDLRNKLYVNPKRRDDFINEIQETGRIENFIYQANTKDGKQIWIRMNGRISEKNEEGSFIIDGFAKDITEEYNTEQKIYHMTFHDKLTGLYNRAYLEEKMEKMDIKEMFPISIIMGDLNNLKLVNDTYGYKAGNDLIISISQIISDSCHDKDIVGRWGGDEFVVLLPNTNLKTAEKICDQINKRCKDNKQELLMSLALGAAGKDSPEERIFTVLKRAEDRMYKNKFANRKSARSNVLSAFLSTLREKSHETEEHAGRMKEMSLALGRKLNLPSSELDKLSLLTLLHDIGKIAIPEEILSKPGKLTDEEWEIIKTHPQAGYRIVASMEELIDIAEGILYHHEKWDGSGYPEKLKGKDIPLLARIIAIVDSFDVMISGRPYKPPMSLEEAINEVRRCAGSQFDPELVEVFVNLIKNEDIDLDH